MRVLVIRLKITDEQAKRMSKKGFLSKSIENITIGDRKCKETDLVSMHIERE